MRLYAQPNTSADGENVGGAGAESLGGAAAEFNVL